MVRRAAYSSFVCVLAILCFTTQSTACPDGPSIVIDTTKVDGFGKYGNFPTLPLEKGQYVLTFDDGPSPDSTPQILKILKDACIPATFFMVGKSAEKNPTLAAKMRMEGFGIGTHTYSHRTLTKLPLDDAEMEIANGIAAVDKVVGPPALGEGRLFRFPNFKYSPGLLAYVRSLGATAAFVDISPGDWRGSPPEETFVRFQNQIRKKDRGVIVLHDVQINTVKLLPMVIDEIHRGGGRFVLLVAKKGPAG